MGRRLYAAEPVFRASIDGCDRAARELGVHEEFGLGVSDALRDGAFPPDSDVRTARWFELICLGALQIALCDLWAAAGVEPDATLSVSLGEMTAPYVSGALTRDEVMAILVRVNRTCTRVMRDGQMFNLVTDSRTARDLCLAAPRPLMFLGTIGPARSMVYSVREDSEENEVFLDGHGVLSRRHFTEFPYHTSLSAFELSRLERELDHLRPRKPRIPMFSSVGGRDIAPDAAFDAQHWHWMVRYPFWYAEATAAALQHEEVVIVNIGPAPVTTPWIRETTDALGIEPAFIDSMRPDDELATWAQAGAAFAGRRRRRRPPARAPSGVGASEGVPVDLALVDLGAPDVVHDPFPLLDGLRSSGPVHHLRRDDLWLVVGHSEVSEAFAQPTLFSSQMMAAVDPFVLGADPPEHTAARRELSTRFSPHALGALSTLVSETAHQILADRATATEFDVVGEFAAPLGDRVAGRLLGIDDRQLAQVRRSIGDAERDPQEMFELIDRALAEVLTDLQPVHRLLWIASTTTTKRAITAAVLLMLDDQALRERVSADTRLLPPLVEEAVRLHPPERMIGRLTTAEATLGGVRIPARSVVQLCLAAANRDPERFPNPNGVDLGRGGASLSFGAGPHRCPGKGLAGLEAEAALSVLLERMPGFHAVQPSCALRWIPSQTTHGVEQLIIAPTGYGGVSMSGRRKSPVSA
jgi:cytochrome P450/malonyl CoA-acyl carrier protein transacylase